ncbi:BTB domain-containing protein [Mycena venus]|uniref:BTB domain-containing protein n=1 Tax=Mycena venus TaxID=2733690 RepID=A0A8H6WPX0_9AGAR|nr:BTB domain-containing protein [Mycena venus]
MTLQHPERSNPEPSPRRSRFNEHPRFFFADGTVIFLVEKNLYRVHRYFFERDSAIFASMFSLPTVAGERPEGEVVENPIILEGVNTVDFDRFLAVLYPINFATRDIASTEEWTSVLSLASRWEFTSLRELAMQHLFLITSAVERIALGRRYDIPSWLGPAYAEVCERKEPLNLAEGRLLGLEDAICIGQVRHTIRYSSNLNRHHDSIVALVRDVFLSP